MQPQVLRWRSGRQILSCHSEQSEESGVAVWFFVKSNQPQVLTPTGTAINTPPLRGRRLSAVAGAQDDTKGMRSLR